MFIPRICGCSVIVWLIQLCEYLDIHFLFSICGSYQAEITQFIRKNPLYSCIYFLSWHFKIVWPQKPVLGSGQTSFLIAKSAFEIAKTILEIAETGFEDAKSGFKIAKTGFFDQQKPVLWLPTPALRSGKQVLRSENRFWEWKNRFYDRPKPVLGSKNTGFCR